MGLPKQLFLLFRIPFPLPEQSYAQICLLKKCANFAIFVAELLYSSRRQVWVYNQVWQNPNNISVNVNTKINRLFYVCISSCEVVGRRGVETETHNKQSALWSHK